jgi:pimeloyl-ACP methyl ester carboxylesterase
VESIPFFIRRFVWRDDVVETGKFSDAGGKPVPIPGYFVMSSAPPNIEDAVEVSPEEAENTQVGIAAIADDLWRIVRQPGSSPAPELTVVVHGYNTRMKNVRAWYSKIFRYINIYDREIAAKPHQVFIGYRWPSETIKLGQLGEVIAALPPLPKALLAVGILLALAALVTHSILNAGAGLGAITTFAIALGVLLVGLMAALVLLRLLVYFRDRYRATNFGVLDLVELLRQLDQAMVEKQALTLQAQDPNLTTGDARKQARRWWQESRRKIKLSFVGHSMGGLVVTNTIRILSDVFDTRSIDKVPVSDIGITFRLERLILASPDIPVLTLISNRSNFLASSLRRFRETYLFSNEGDIALRIASTAANYIAFPSRTQSRGYRLGNVALRTNLDQHEDYGLVNLDHLRAYYDVDTPLGAAIATDPAKIMESLFISYSRRHRGGYITLADLFEKQSDRQRDRATLADLFTFFDCTDYKDGVFDVEALAPKEQEPQRRGLLTRAKRKRALNLLDYMALTLDYGLGRRDVHGGYFQGEFCQLLLYRLAFLGFGGLMDSLGLTTGQALKELDQRCRTLGIQGFLSPLRYRVACQEADLRQAKEELLNAITASASDDVAALSTPVGSDAAGAVTQWPYD